MRCHFALRDTFRRDFHSNDELRNNDVEHYMCIGRADVSAGVSRAEIAIRCVISTDERANIFVTDGYPRCTMAMHLFSRF